MIDARGQLCPMPVIMVQKAAKENPAMDIVNISSIENGKRDG